MKHSFNCPCMKQPVDTITEKERKIASHRYALACFEDILTNGETIDEGNIAWINDGWASPEYAMVFAALIAIVDEDKPSLDVV